MEDFCECECHEKNFNDTVNFFMKNYGAYLKIKGKNIKTKKDFDEAKTKYNLLVSLVKSLKPKGENAINNIKACHKDHSKLVEEISSKIEQTDNLLENINHHFDSIKQTMPEIEEEEDEDDIENNNDKENDNKNFENMTDEQIMENDRQSIIMIQNLLDDEEYRNKNKEDKKHIIQIKNQLNDVLKNIEIELNNNNEQIDNIEDNVEQSLDLVDKGNDNLEKAAKSAVTRRRIKYQLGFAAVLGGIGTVVPGLGNVVGAALGGLIGYGVYRIDRHRLNKILKKRKEELEKRKKDGKGNDQ